MPPHRAITLAAAIALIAAACAGPRTVGEPTAAPVATATLRPTPSPTPFDLGEQFLASLAVNPSIQAELSGRLEAGVLTGEFSGEIQVAGGNTYVHTVITFPGQPPHVTETLNVRGTTYEKTAEGLWMEMGNGSAEGSNQFARALQSEPDLVRQGTFTHEGATLHRLVLAGPEMGPDALGMPADGAVDFAAEFAFLAEDDGTPAGFMMTATWSDGPSGPGLMEMVYRFTSLGEVITIGRPEEAWRMHTSAAFGYRMAYPVRWDVLYEPETEEYADHDVFLGPVDSDVQVVHWDDIEEGTPANGWLRFSADYLEGWFGTRPEILEDITLADGLSARIFEMHVETEDDEFFFQQAAIFGGDRAWDINWWSTPGNEEADRAFFMNFVRTFERVDES